MRSFVRAVFMSLCAVCLAAMPLASAPLRQETVNATNAPLTNAFTYQGRLEKGGALVNAACSMTFSLFDAQTEGTKIGNDQSINPVNVSAGLFTVTLNGSGEFGTSAFDGSARYLQIAVLCPGDAAAVNLPRQQLTAAPYAITSLSTEGLQGRPVSTVAPSPGQALAWDGTQWTPQTIITGSGPIAWSNLSGIPAGFDDDVDNDSGGDITAVTAGSGLTGGGSSGTVGLALDTSVTDSLYWQTDGNSGLPPTALLGTTDNTTLTLAVNNTAALRIEPADTPNLIGGHPQNSVTAGVKGATISGGGSYGVDTHQAFDDYGTIGGGLDNTVGLDNGNLTEQSYATVAGGEGNTATEFGASVGGGRFNKATEEYSSIGGGRINEATARYATIPGGEAAVASLRGQFAYASGGFEDGFGTQDEGSAQTSIYVLRAEGSGTQTLFLDGDNDALIVRPKSTIAYTILVVGRSTTATDVFGAFRLDGVISATDAGGGFIASGSNLLPETTLVEHPVGTLSAGVSMTGGTIMVTVGNTTGQAMRWVATVYATEVVE